MNPCAFIILSVLALAPAFPADPKSDAHALLVDWLDAQNTGNFEASRSARVSSAPDLVPCVRRDGAWTYCAIEDNPLEIRCLARIPIASERSLS